MSVLTLILSGAPADTLGAGGAASTFVDVVVRATTPATHSSPPPARGPHTLPFTGSQLLLFVTIALLLLVAGTGLRRLAA